MTEALYTTGCCWFVLVYAFKSDLSECDRNCCKARDSVMKQNTDLDQCFVMGVDDDDNGGCIISFTHKPYYLTVQVSVMLLLKLFYR